MKKLQKGFTLIELLVVIAIIGILSSVVLASLSTARTKGQDAAVQSQLSSMRAQAELFFSTTGANTYGTVGTTAGACSPAGATVGTLFTGVNGLDKLLAAITGAKDCGTGAAGVSWAVAAALPSGGFYCVDSTGVSRSTTAAGVAYTSLNGGAAGAKSAAGAATCN